MKDRAMIAVLRKGDGDLGLSPRLKCSAENLHLFKCCYISVLCPGMDVWKGRVGFSAMTTVFEFVARTSVEFPNSILGKKYNFSLMLHPSLGRNTRKPLSVVAFWQSSQVQPGTRNPQSKKKEPFTYNTVGFGRILGLVCSWSHWLTGTKSLFF